MGPFITQHTFNICAKPDLTYERMNENQERDDDLAGKDDETRTLKVPRLFPALLEALVRAGAVLGTAALPAPWGMGGV